MKKTVPDFLRDFHCIASACQDTCCAGWEIEVDSVSAEYYRSIPGAFGEELRKRLETEEGEDFFRLTRQRRCPFLDEQNLCRIYQNLGEDALCDICTCLLYTSSGSTGVFAAVDERMVRSTSGDNGCPLYFDVL